VAQSHSLLVYHIYMYIVHSYTTHSFITFAEFRSSFLIDSCSCRGPPLRFRAEIRTRGRRTAVQCDTNWATPQPNRATPHPQLSYAAPHTEPRRNPNWATTHPQLSHSAPATEPRRTPYYLRTESSERKKRRGRTRKKSTSSWFTLRIRNSVHIAIVAGNFDASLYHCLHPTPNVKVIAS
jgi:hypothetical protein